MSPSDLGVFGLVKRAAAADEAGGSNAAAGNTAAAGWLGKGCGARVVRELRLLHRATQDGKQGCAWAAWCRNETYQRCSLDVCRGQTHCVRVWACRQQGRDREQTGWRLWFPANMSFLLQK